MSHVREGKEQNRAPDVQDLGRWPGGSERVRNAWLPGPPGPVYDRAMIEEQVMDVELILEELRYAKADRRFPRRAMAHAIVVRQEITPHLLSALEDTRHRYRELAEDSSYMAHLRAACLLAQCRERGG